MIGKETYVLDELEVKPKPVEDNNNNNQPTKEKPAYRPSTYDANYNYSYPGGYYASSYKGAGSEGSSDPCAGNNPPITCYEDGNLPHPGKLNWSIMSNNQRLAHVVKAMKYAQSKGIPVNLNDYFYKLPDTGNSGLGKQYRISGSILINGVSVPITIELPIIKDERIFNPVMLGSPTPKYVGHATYQHQFNYYYGLGDKFINSVTINVPGIHEERFTNFIER